MDRIKLTMTRTPNLGGSAWTVRDKAERSKQVKLSRSSPIVFTTIQPWRYSHFEHNPS